MKQVQASLERQGFLVIDPITGRSSLPEETMQDLGLAFEDPVDDFEQEEDIEFAANNAAARLGLKDDELKTWLMDQLDKLRAPVSHGGMTLKNIKMNLQDDFELTFVPARSRMVDNEKQPMLNFILF